VTCGERKKRVELLPSGLSALAYLDAPAARRTEYRCIGLVRDSRVGDLLC